MKKEKRKEKGKEKKQKKKKAIYENKKAKKGRTKERKQKRTKRNEMSKFLPLHTPKTYNIYGICFNLQYTLINRSQSCIIASPQEKYSRHLVSKGL